MSISAPRVRLISRALDGISEEDTTLALSTRSLKTSYKGPCVQVRRDPPENSLVFVSKVDGLYNDRLEGVVVSAGGDTYAAGFQRAATFYNAQGPNYGYVAPCIAKYTANGSPVWIAGIEAFTSGGSRIDAGLDGNVFVSAFVSRSATSFPVYSSSGVATPLLWSTTRSTGSPLVKYTSNGSVEWAASVRSEGYNVVARGVASDEASGAYVCGSCTGGAADTVSNVVMYESSGVAGATLNATGSLGVGWLGRFNSTGNVLWATSISASEFSLSGVVADGSGGVVACGDITVASGTTANVLHSNGAVFSTFTTTSRSGLVVKYDAAGTALAAWKPTGAFTGRSCKVASDGTGNIYLSGNQQQSRNIYNSNNSLAGQFGGGGGGVAAFLVKFNSDLNAVWWTSVDGLENEASTSVAADANGVYLTGYYGSTAGGTANIYHANTAVAGVLPFVANGGGFCIRYSPTGNVTSWSSTSSGSIEGVALDPIRNRAMVVGYSASGTTANIISQSGTVLSSVTATTEAGFLGAFQLGSTTKDIGFKGGSLDTSALLKHCPPGSNGYVQTLYSQSPALATPIVEEYPPAPMTADTTTLSGQAYGNGTYVANASSVHTSGYRASRAFDRLLTADFTDNSRWHSAFLTYSGGLALNTTAVVDGIGVPGEWLELKLPAPVILSGYGIMRSDVYNGRVPRDFVIAGSNDGVVWYGVDARTGQTGYVISTLKQFTISPASTTPYRYFRMIVSRLVYTSGGDTAAEIGEWRLYSTYSDRNARQFVEENQPLLIENGTVKGSNRPLIDFSGGKSLTIGNDATAAGTPMYTANTSGLGQSTYTSTISSSEVIGVRSSQPTIPENQQFAYGSTPNTLQSARATIGSAPILDRLSQNAQTSCLAAFSFRRLFLEYKGPVVRLRRESDNVERDFYGSPSAIEAWIGSSSARVVTLYDQSSSNKNATQITPANQPQVAKQFGVYVAHFNGTFQVPQYMTFANIYPASFWSQYYSATTYRISTIFAQYGGDFGFRMGNGGLGLQPMTTNNGTNYDFLGSNVNTTPYWVINGYLGNNFQDPKGFPQNVWNRVTGSRMTPTPSTRHINSIGRGRYVDLRDFNGSLAELVFWSKPALVSDALLLDASPLVKTTSTFLSQTLNTTIGRLGALVSRGFPSILNAVQIMSSFASTSSGPRTGSGPLILNNQNFGNFQYVVKRGSFSIQTGYTPTDYFSPVKDTAAAFVVIDGDLSIQSGCIFTPPTRKLFTVLYITGDLVLDGEISKTARGCNHNATGDSVFSSVFPAQDIIVFGGEFGDLFGATNAFVPAGGGGGGTGGETSSFNASAGGPGNYGTSGRSGGGGGGGYGGGYPLRANGGAGTSFSGGTGGGGVAQNPVYTTIPLPGEPNGGLGGAGVYIGAYNSGFDGAGNGPNGTGGTLIVICKGTVSGSGKITSHGSLANTITNASFVGGGGSGGGSAWLLAGSGGDTIKVTATGGGRANGRSGLGGNGSAMKIILQKPLVSTSTRSSVIGAYSLRRLLSGWGGPVVRIRHGTTNEQRNFYAEDLEIGAALDVFLGGAIPYIAVWYDQTGSNHASQTITTSQPWIVRDASWTTKPTVRCGGTGFLNYNGAGLVNTDYTVAVSTARTSNANLNFFLGGTALTLNQNLILGYRSSTIVTVDQYNQIMNMTVADYTVPIPETYVFRHSSTLGKNTHRDGSFLGQNTTNFAPITAYAGSTIGAWRSGTYQGDISEVTLLASYVSDPERSLLESSMITALGTSSGLVLHLDAYQHTSGSTTWTDISGSGYNFDINAGAYTVTSGVSYMNFGGSFGTAQYKVGGVLTDVPSFANATFIVFTRILNSTATFRTLIQNSNSVEPFPIIINTGGNTLGAFSSGFRSSGYDVSTGGMVGNWSMGVWKLSTSSPYYSFSKNKDPTTYVMNSVNVFTRGFSFIGGRHASSQYWGDVGQFMYYNRHLSQTEIDGIYDMYKGRYGLA